MKPQTSSPCASSRHEMGGPRSLVPDSPAWLAYWREPDPRLQRNQRAYPPRGFGCHLEGGGTIDRLQCR